MRGGVSGVSDHDDVARRRAGHSARVAVGVDHTHGQVDHRTLEGARRSAGPQGHIHLVGRVTVCRTVRRGGALVERDGRVAIDGPTGARHLLGVVADQCGRLGESDRTSGGDRTVVGVGVGQGRRCTTGRGGHGHRDGPGPGRDDDGERARAGHVDRGARVGAEGDLVEPETKPEPVSVTVLVPPWGPLFGLTLVTVGGVL